MENAPCALCGASDSEPLVTTGDRLAAAREDDAPRHDTFTIVRCRSCGLAFLDPRPSADEIGAYYPSDYNVPGRGGRLERYEEAYRARAQREVVRWLAQVKPSRGRLLDVGSAAVARERHGLTIHDAMFDDAELPAAAYDAVVFASVLEHLPDPVASLTRARDLLAPHGVVAVLFLPLLDSPQAKLFGSRWLGLDAPRHLYHFEHRTFARAAQVAGLHIVATRSYSRRHNASIWTASALPGLQKQRMHVLQRSRPAAAAARKAAFVGVTAALRPLARVEALAHFEGVRSYFLVAG